MRLERRKIDIKMTEDSINTQQEPNKLKKENDILKEKNFVYSLKVCELKDLCSDFREEINQLKKDLKYSIPKSKFLDCVSSYEDSIREKNIEINRLLDIISKIPKDIRDKYK
jgi:hypothetical protein